MLTVVTGISTKTVALTVVGAASYTRRGIQGAVALNVIASNTLYAKGCVVVVLSGEWCSRDNGS